MNFLHAALGQCDLLIGTIGFCPQFFFATCEVGGVIFWEEGSEAPFG